MKTKIFLLISLFGMLMLAGNAYAMTIDITSHSHHENVDVLEEITVDFNIVSPYDEYTGFTIIGLLGQRIHDLPDVSIAGEMVRQDVTTSGTYTFTVDNDNFFMDTMLPIVFHVYPFNMTTSEYYPEETNTSITLMLGSPSSTVQYHIIFREHQPSSNDRTAGSYLVENSVHSVKTTLLKIVGTDAYTVTADLILASSRNIDDELKLRYIGLREDISYHTSEYSRINNVNYYHGREYYVFTARPDTAYDWNQSWYMHYGYRILPLQNIETTMNAKTPVMSSTNARVYSDDTCGSVLWSMDGYYFRDNIGNIHNGVTTNTEILNDLGNPYDYIGALAYIPTGEYPIASFLYPSLSISTFGVIIHEYGISIGMPWFFMLIVFLIIGVCVSIPFSFAVKYNLDMPNIIYGGSIVLGVWISFALGILPLWMLFLFIAAVVLTVMLRFKEPLGVIFRERTLDFLRSTDPEKRLERLKASRELRKIKKDAHAVKAEKKKQRWIEKDIRKTEPKPYAFPTPEQRAIRRAVTAKGTPKTFYSKSYEKKMKDYFKYKGYWVKRKFKKEVT